MRAARLFGLMLASSSLLATTASADQLFDYQLRNLGHTNNRPACEALISEIAEGFKQQSGITPFAAGCKVDDVVGGPFLYGVISYFADSRLNMISSVDNFGGTDSPGGYTTREACEATLPARIEQFQAIFDKEPFAAFCYQVYEYDRVFAARLDAVGTSTIKGTASGFELFGRPVGNPQDILDSLQAAAERRFPGRVMDASFNRSLGYARATVRYYSDTRLWMDNLDEMKFKTTEACVDALADLRPIFTSFTEEPAALFCTADGLSGIRANIVTFSNEIGSPDTYRWYQAPTTFSSREECLENRGALSNDRVAGAICTDTTPSVMHLILKPN